MAAAATNNNSAGSRGNDSGSVPGHCHPDRSLSLAAVPGNACLAWLVSRATARKIFWLARHEGLIRWGRRMAMEGEMEGGREGMKRRKAHSEGEQR